MIKGGRTLHTVRAQIYFRTKDSIVSIVSSRYPRNPQRSDGKKTVDVGAEGLTKEYAKKAQNIDHDFGGACPDLPQSSEVLHSLPESLVGWKLASKPLARFMAGASAAGERPVKMCMPLSSALLLPDFCWLGCSLAGEGQKGQMLLNSQPWWVMWGGSSPLRLSESKQRCCLRGCSFWGTALRMLQGGGRGQQQLRQGRAIIWIWIWKAPLIDQCLRYAHFMIQTSTNLYPLSIYF